MACIEDNTKEKKCVCETENLEQDDNLYKMIDFDGGFGFDIIFDIKYTNPGKTGVYFFTLYFYIIFYVAYFI